MSPEERSPKRQKVSESNTNNVGDLLRKFSEIEEQLERAKKKEKYYQTKLDDAEMKPNRASKKEDDLYKKYKKVREKTDKISLIRQNIITKMININPNDDEPVSITVVKRPTALSLKKHESPNGLFCKYWGVLRM